MTTSDPLTQQIRAAQDHFTRHFGRPARYAAIAPGRVNLIGEHTDYNDGFVLPMAIERQTLILAAPPPAPGNEKYVRLISTIQEGETTFNLTPALAKGQPKWANYVKGVVKLFLDQGLMPPGFDALIDSTVPLGGGLSSSAALEVAAATLLECLTGKQLDPVAKALLCQKAEHTFAGVPCGIMDQYISVMAQAGHAMLLDCRSHHTHMVPLADPRIEVLIANTNVRHELSGGEYTLRRRQCEQAAQAIGVKSLRDATPQLLAANRTKLDPAAFRRARHVIGEIARTTQAATLMEAGNWSAVGELMYQSHESLRDDYEVSCAELDLLVDLARALGETGGVYGSRMTGGGFGGCTVSLVQSDRVAQVTQYLHDRYHAQTGIEPTLFATRPAAGTRIVQL